MDHMHPIFAGWLDDPHTLMAALLSPIAFLAIIMVWVLTTEWAPTDEA